MICLGIESTAHTFGVGIVEEKKGKIKVLANVKDSYTTESGGIIPTDASKHHKEKADLIIEKAISEAKIKLEDIDIIAFSQGPGLSPCLLVGLNKAKELAEKLKKPLIPVNHCIAHLEVGKTLCGAKDPVLLYASGANTQIIAYSSGKYRIFGETLDMGVGNFIDSFARHSGLGFPGGPKISLLADKSRSLIELPYSVKGMDVSFSGLLTNLNQKFDRMSNSKYTLENLSYSLQETAFAMLVEVAERAMAHCNKKELLLGGGVACNKRLQEMCKIMCEERRAKFFCPENQYLLDNGVMIANSGILRYKERKTLEVKKADIKPYERTDDKDL